MTINDRVKQLRTELIKERNDGKKMTLEEFGARLSIGNTAVSKIEHGENAVTDRTVAAICTEFGVREEWLRYGEGEPFRKVSEDYKLAEWLGEVMSEDESDIQRRLLKVLSGLSPAQWDLIADIADRLAEELKKGEE